MAASEDAGTGWMPACVFCSVELETGNGNEDQNPETEHRERASVGHGRDPYFARGVFRAPTRRWSCRVAVPHPQINTENAVFFQQIERNLNPIKNTGQPRGQILCSSNELSVPVNEI